MTVTDDIIRIAKLGFVIKVFTLALEKKRIRKETEGRVKWF